MIVAGLTGSIGMGKSTTAGMFRELGIAVNDSDETVHDLYRREAAPLVAEAFLGSVSNGVVDRQELSRQLTKNPERFRELEAIIHPLVRERQREFIRQHRLAGDAVVVLDIPLLFETSAEDRVDAIVVVTCDPEIQKQRVLARPNMTEEKFALILSRQIPDSEKRKKADYIVDTGHGFASARSQVEHIVAKLQTLALEQSDL